MPIKRLPFWLFPLFVLVFAGLFFLPAFFKGQGFVSVEHPVQSRVFERFDKENLLVFFGYVGCTDICIPRLGELAAMYGSLSEAQKAKVDVVFINITQLSDPEQPGLFSRSFDPSFKGVYLEQKALHRLMVEFKARYAPSLLDKEEYDHTAFLYLLQKEKKGYTIKGIFTNIPFNKDVIIAHLFPDEGT